MKSLANCENPSSNPLHESRSVFPKDACDSEIWKLFRKPSVILKIVPKAGHEMYTREIQKMRAKERRNRNVMRLTEQSLGLLVSVFK